MALLKHPFQQSFWLGCCLLGACGSAIAQLGEGDLKAALVFNFAKFVEWPALPADGQFGICLVGTEDSMLTALSRLEGKQVQGREIRVRAVRPRTDAIKGCQILVVGESETAKSSELARLAMEHGTLSVSAADQFVENGGAIGLVTIDNRVQFEVNLDTAQKSGLKLAAQFVKLARKVKK